jgi:hypothetical protein
MAGIGRLEYHVGELLGYLERNQGALVHYAARRRNGEPISTAFVESSVNEIIAKRMNLNPAVDVALHVESPAPYWHEQRSSPDFGSPAG